MTVVGNIIAILFWLIVTSIGVFCVVYSFYIMKQMEDAGSPDSPNREDAQGFLEDLMEDYDEDFFDLYRATIHLFTSGLLLAIIGIVALPHVILLLIRQ